MAAGADLGEVTDHVVRDEIPLEGFLYEGVRDASKSVLQVKKGDMGCPLLLLGISYNFLRY